VELSKKGRKLIEMYAVMARDGYVRTDGAKIGRAYEAFELKRFRRNLRPLFTEFGVVTVLDYGSGGSNWDLAGFDDETGLSAVDYFGLESVARFEPARGIDQRAVADCVVCFYVLEHVLIADILHLVRDLFANSGKLLVVNVACYKAFAKLPNGQNAHVTVR